MSESSVEDIVARLEADLFTVTQDDIRALIALWRERGEALERIVQWSKAYPLDIFPEPDLKRARSLLEAGGVTLDAVSASAMRRVVKGVGEIARAALAAEPASGTGRA